MLWSKVESALHALTMGKACKENSLAYCTMRHIAKSPYGAKLWPKEEVKKLWLQIALYAKYTDKSKVKLAMDGTNKEEMNALYKFCYKEAIYRLQVHFFGDDLFGRNVYQQLTD